MDSAPSHATAGKWCAWHPSMRLVALALTEAATMSSKQVHVASTLSSLHRWGRHRLFDRQLVRLINQHVRNYVPVHVPNHQARVVFAPATDDLVMVSDMSMVEILHLPTGKRTRYLGTDPRFTGRGVVRVCARFDAPVVYFVTSIGIWEFSWAGSSSVTKLWQASGDCTGKILKCHPTQPEIFVLQTSALDVYSHAGVWLRTFQIHASTTCMRSLAVDAVAEEVYVVVNHHDIDVYSSHGTFLRSFLKLTNHTHMFCLAIDSKRRLLRIAGTHRGDDKKIESFAERIHLVTHKQWFNPALTGVDAMNLDVHEETGQVLLNRWYGNALLVPPSLV